VTSPILTPGKVNLHAIGFRSRTIFVSENEIEQLSASYSILEKYYHPMCISSSVLRARGYPRREAGRSLRGQTLMSATQSIPSIPLCRYISQSRTITMRSLDVYTIAALDSAPEWTLDQIAGLVFASLLVTLYFSSKLVDEYVATSQRIELGICQKCGGLNSINECKEKECPVRTRAK